MMSHRFAFVVLGLAAALLSGCAGTNGVLNLSHYDPATPNFAAIRNSGVQGVIHEATYPPGVGDEKYAERQESATRAGLLWGAYHFANNSDPIRQADQFLGFVAAHPPPAPNSDIGVLLVLDFERNTHYPGGTMTIPQAIAFLQRVKERTGHYPGLYTNENRVHEVLNHPSVPEGAREELRRAWLWVANYHRRPEDVDPWSKWTLWQYTGDGVCEMPRGSYPIHACNVRNAERNIYAGSQSDLVHFWRENAWHPWR